MSNTTHRRLIRLPAVMDRTGLGRTSIYDGVTKGSFPSPVKIGARAAAWVEREVDEWIEEQIRRSRGEDAA